MIVPAIDQGVPMSKSKKSGCRRLVGGCISLLIGLALLVVLAIAGLVVEAEVRSKQALTHLSTSVQGPDDGSVAQRRQGHEMTVALAQMNPVPLDTAANLEKVAGFLKLAQEQGAELLVLPELALTGLHLGDGIWQAAEPLDGPTVGQLKALAAEYQMDIVTSVVESADGDIFNTAIYVTPEGSAHAGRKLHPPMAEAARFAPGDGPQVVGTVIGRVGMVLCADAFRAETFANLAEADPDIVLLMAAAPLPDLQLPGMRAYTPEEWSALAAFYSDRLGVPVVSAHASGPTSLEIPWQSGMAVDATYAGASRIVSRRTRVTTSTPRDQEMITATQVFIGRLGPQIEAETYGDYLVPRSFLFHTFVEWSESQGTAFYAANRP